MTPPECVNFQASKIYTQSNNAESKFYHKILDWEDYKLMVAKSFLAFENLTIEKSEKGYDFLSVKVDGMFLSERLENLIVEHKLTGLDILKDSTQLDFSD